MVVGNVRLAVRPEQCAVRVDAGNGVVEIVAVALKEADGQHNVQLPRQTESHLHGGIFVRRRGIGVKIVAALLAEILPLKQLRQQDDLRTLPGGLPHEALGRAQIFGGIGDAAHLDGCHNDVSHNFAPSGICCVMQWILPPPVKISRA